jgi:nicotinate-nucleotide adenylyltransferase
MAKIGILGGTFDPPHIGHLITAQEVLVKQQLDEVWFLLSAQPPHKKTGTPSEYRIEMVQKAIKLHPKFKLCSIEMERKGPSYTVQTMKELNEKYPDHQFFFIIGADMVNSLSSWHQINELLAIVTFIGVKRPGYELNENIPHACKLVDTAQVFVSSTDIRNRVKNKDNIKYLVPDEVKQYIEEKSLYGAE